MRRLRSARPGGVPLGPFDSGGSGCNEPQSNAPLDVVVDVRASSNHAFWQGTWVGVASGPGLSPLSLSRAPSSPAELIVEFTLPVSAPASLEVFDAAGRRLLSRSLAGLEPGPHRLSLASRGELPSGSYFVRLRQGAIARSVTVSMLR